MLSAIKFVICYDKSESFVSKKHEQLRNVNKCYDMIKSSKIKALKAVPKNFFEFGFVKTFVTFYLFFVSQTAEKAIC